MSETSTKLALPYIMPSQAQKHVTHNEAIRMLDALVQLELASIGAETPPVTPVEGECHALGGVPTGDWAGQAGKVAAFQDGAWAFFAPQSGWLAWDQAQARLVAYSGGGWVAAGGDGGGGIVDQLGIGTAADTNNRLAVASPGTLLTHEGAGHQVKVNKNADTDTASLLYQTGWSGRAEMGLAGDDDFHIKVSPDGAAWHEALVIDRTSGAVTLPESGIANHAMVSLLSDGGRLCDGAINSITAGNFAFPSYLTLYNNTLAAGHQKTVYDSATYGGAAPALEADAQALTEKIRDQFYRRYAVEFWIAMITHGDGQLLAGSYGGFNHYLSLFSWFQPRSSHLTFHCYMQALDNPIVVNRNNGQTIWVDGVQQASHALIDPADGWVSVRIWDIQPPRYLSAHSPNPLYIYARQAGDRYLMACPALLAGAADPGTDAGLIPPAGIW